MKVVARKEGLKGLVSSVEVWSGALGGGGKELWKMSIR
jgi:hypothetical protein